MTIVVAARRGASVLGSRAGRSDAQPAATSATPVEDGRGEREPGLVCCEHGSLPLGWGYRGQARAAAAVRADADLFGAGDVRIAPRGRRAGRMRAGAGRRRRPGRARALRPAMAPPRTMSKRRSGMPARMYCPRPPRSTYAAIVTVATTCSVAERRPRDEQRQPERHLDAPQDLPLRHAHRAGRVDDLAIDGLEAGVGTREDRRDRQQHERDDRRLGRAQHAEEQHQQDEQAEGRDRARRTRDRHREVAPLAGVPDQPAERDGDERRDQHGDEGVQQVLRAARPEWARARPVSPEKIQAIAWTMRFMRRSPPAERRAARAAALRARPRHERAAGGDQQTVDRRVR